MTPILFIANAKESSLIDPAAIGQDTNPFRSKLTAWESLGLLDFIQDVDTSRWCGWQEITAGPEGLAGFAFRVLPKGSTQDAAPIVSRTTEWLRASDRVWFSRESFTPSDLLRYSFQPLPTHKCLLSDGQVWEVPRIRRTMTGGYITAPTNNDSELPQRIRRTWEGQIIVEPSPRWLDLWNESTRFAQSLWGDDVVVSYLDLMTFGIRVLQIRYRFSELFSRAFPEILEAESLMRIAKAACGWDLVEAEIQKKRQAPEEAVSQ